MARPHKPEGTTADKVLGLRLTPADRILLDALLRDQQQRNGFVGTVTAADLVRYLLRREADARGLSVANAAPARPATPAPSPNFRAPSSASTLHSMMQTPTTPRPATATPTPVHSPGSQMALVAPGAAGFAPSTAMPVAKASSPNRPTASLPSSATTSAHAPSGARATAPPAAEGPFAHDVQNKAYAAFHVYLAANPGLPIARVAEKIGMLSTNLSAFRNGRRPLPMNRFDAFYAVLRGKTPVTT